MFPPAAPARGNVDALSNGPGAPAAGGPPPDDSADQIGKLRELDMQVQQTFADMPQASQQMQVIRQQIKIAVQQVVQTASLQTPSAQAIPFSG